MQPPADRWRGLSFLGRALKGRENCQHGQGQNTDQPQRKEQRPHRLVGCPDMHPRPSRPAPPRKAPQRGSPRTQARQVAPPPASMPETARRLYRVHKCAITAIDYVVIVPLGLAALTTPLWCAPHSRERAQNTSLEWPKRPKLPAHGYRRQRFPSPLTPPRRR